MSSFEDSTFKVILHCLKSELQKRQNAYKKLSNLFVFLKNLEEANNEKIRECSQSLVMAYPEDLEDDLSEELIQFSALLKTDLGADMDKKKNKEVQMYKLIKENGLESAYPNVNIVLRIYLSLMVTNCSGERSFSKLKHVKISNELLLAKTNLIT